MMGWKEKWAPQISMFQCKLCWKITIGVFCAIMIVEIGILYFSIDRYRNDRLAEVEREALVVMRTILRASDETANLAASFPETAKKFRKNSVLLGAIYYAPDGAVIASFGQLPYTSGQAAPDPTGITQRTVAEDISYMDVLWPVGRVSDQSAVAVRVDATEIEPQVDDFIWRVTGLVVVISLFVTIVTMMLLEKMILSPIRGLRDQLDRAAKDPNHPAEYALKTDHRDEWGDVITALNEMLKQSDANLHKIREQESELIKHKECLEMVVEKRTENLKDALLRAEAASKAKSAFLSNMSHELRTPVNGMIGFSDLLRQEAFGPIGHENYLDYASEINNSANRLLNLVNRLLDVTNLESGDVQLQEQAFDIGSLVRSAQKSSQAEAKETDVIVQSEVPTETVVMKGDEGRIKQILCHILSNAVKFSSSSGTVWIRLFYRPGGEAEIRVEDQGQGMDADSLERVLESFGQAETSYARDHEGAGLGLTIARMLTEFHGGTLTISSEEGVGTAVSLVFPEERITLIPNDKAKQASAFAGTG